MLNKKYLLITFLILIISQFGVAQTTKPLNNGRTPDQVPKVQPVKPAEPAPKATSRNKEQDLGDEGQYANRLDQAESIDFQSVNTQLQTIADQYAALQLSHEALQIELDNIKKSLNLCCGGSRLNSLTNRNALGAETAYLMQNAPNPFYEETAVQFFVPYEVSLATLHIRDLSGRILNTIRLEDRGLSTIHIDRKFLETGSYVYTLEVDGQLVDSKIMILTK